MTSRLLSLWARYGFTLYAVGLAVVMPLLFPTLEPAASTLALAAVTASAWAGGPGPGLAATALAALALNFFFLAPVCSLGVSQAGGVQQLVVFALVAVFI